MPKSHNSTSEKIPQFPLDCSIKRRRLIDDNKIEILKVLIEQWLTISLEFDTQVGEYGVAGWVQGSISSAGAKASWVFGLVVYNAVYGDK